MIICHDTAVDAQTIVRGGQFSRGASELWGHATRRIGSPISGRSKTSKTTTTGRTTATSYASGTAQSHPPHAASTKTSRSVLRNPSHWRVASKSPAIVSSHIKTCCLAIVFTLEGNTVKGTIRSIGLASGTLRLHFGRRLIGKIQIVCVSALLLIQGDIFPCGHVELIHNIATRGIRRSILGVTQGIDRNGLTSTGQAEVPFRSGYHLPGTRYSRGRPRKSFWLFQCGERANSQTVQLRTTLHTRNTRGRSIRKFDSKRAVLKTIICLTGQ